jgi:hypothetical protein
MNKIAKNSDFNRYDQYIQIIKSIKNVNHSLRPDALLKWSSIMSMLDTLGHRPLKILDIGSGFSHLANAIDLMLNNSVEHIICIDREFVGCSAQLGQGKITLIRSDYFVAQDMFVSGYFDLIIDACAVTHFDTESKFAPNDGCFRVGMTIKRLLNKRGIFLCSSDVLLCDDDVRTGEYVSPMSMINSYEAGGLNLTGSFNSCRSDQFIVPEAGNDGYAIVKLCFTN